MSAISKVLADLKKGHQCKREANNIFVLIGLNYCSQHYATTENSLVRMVKGWARTRGQKDTCFFVEDFSIPTHLTKSDMMTLSATPPKKGAE